MAELFGQGDSAPTSKAKGSALEEAITYLFESIPGVEVIERNILDEAHAQEIDLAFWNSGDPNGLRQFDLMPFVECKNWSKPVGHSEVAVFCDKLRSRARPLGILVAAQGITGDPTDLSSAHRQIARALEQGREILVLTREEIEELSDTDDLVQLLKRKRLQLAVSGTSIGATST